MENMELWNNLKRPPPESLKRISGGRLNGMTDIKPQWRYQAMTEQFGMCGIGWKYTVEKEWLEQGPDGQVFAFVDVNLYTWMDGEDMKWSSPIPGTGGAMLVEKEKAGLHANDEAFKMATTDALGTAMKMLGVAADIYAGLWDGSKYKDTNPPSPERKAPPASSSQALEAQTGGAYASAHENLNKEDLHQKIVDELKAQKIAVNGWLKTHYMGNGTATGQTVKFLQELLDDLKKNNKPFKEEENGD